MWFLVVLAILASAVLWPRTGRLLLSTLALAVMIASAVVIHDREKERDARTRIAPRQLQVQDALLRRDGTGLYSLRAKIRNRSSQHTVSAVTAKITLEDCDSTGECEIVLERPVIVSCRIAPGELREVQAGGIGSQKLELKGSLHWGYEVTGVRAVD